MKRIILHIASLCVTALLAAPVWGQTSIKGTWAGGALTGSYKLIGNTTLTGTVSVSSATLTIDLNGYTLDRKGTKAADFLFIVGEDRTLNIKDSSADKTGKITGGRGDRGGCALISGILNFTGGEVTGCIATDGNYGDTPTTNTDVANMHYVTQGCGGAFFVNSGATLNMSGTAKITNCKTEKFDGTHGRGGAVLVAGTFNMSGGTISGCEASWGGAVFVFNGARNAYYNNDTRSGTFKMTGGTITACKSYSDGCGIYTQSKVEISGSAKITSNRPLKWKELQLEDNKYPQVQLTGGHGGAIYATGDKAVVTMSGGELSNNLAESGGAVMLWTGSTMTMTGGKMDGNYAMGKPSLGNGGALYLQGSTFNFNGGTLSNNVANRYGGAINTNSGATLNISGNCVITGNRASHGGGISQEAGECSLTLEGTGIEISNNEAHGHQVNISDKGVYSVTDALGNGGGIFIEKGTVIMRGPKINNNKASGHGGGASLYVKRIHGRNTTVTIDGGEISNNEAQYGGGIDVYANFQSLNDTYNANDPYTGKSNLTVNFNAGTLSGNKASVNGAGIYVGFNETYSTATMTIGTATSTPVISGNIAGESGGGFGMTNQGVITVKNMTASNNKANIGGAIWLGEGQFTLEEGEFKNNEAETHGGGIYVGSGTFTVTNTTLQGNKAHKGNGGGIYLGGGTFTVKNSGVLILGGTDGNNAGVNGGAVYCNAPFTVNNNVQLTMQNNSAGENGGAVYCNDKFTVGTNGNFKMQNNSAGNDGGAVYCNAAFTVGTYGNFEMQNNSADNDGGAVYCNAAFSIGRESKIINNRASKDGGAVYVNEQNISLVKNEISGNSANSGGALYVNGGNIVLSGASTMSNNRAAGNGGVGFVNKGTLTTASGNEITLNDNIAANGSGGAFYIKGDASTKGHLLLQGKITISKNEAQRTSDAVTANGGAFFIQDGDVTMSAAATIQENKALDNGGAFYVGSGNVSIDGVAQIMSNSSNRIGGAFFVYNGSVAMSQAATIQSNTAVSDGGAFYVSGGNVTMGADATINENQSSDGNGGAFFVNSGNVSIAGDAQIKTNSSKLGGGAFYVNGGSITTNTGVMSENSSTSGNGGVFFVNGGNIKLSGLTTMTNNNAKNGGAVALQGGVFDIDDNNSLIQNNTASQNGGGLWVNNNSSSRNNDMLTIAFNGGSFIANKAETGNGGGIFATGALKLDFGANVKQNKAQNGGGIYIADGVNMDFVSGLVVLNEAKKATDNSTETGIGGGIYMANNAKLNFVDKSELGIYNNTADYEAADIYTKGDGTVLNLPYVKTMNLRGYDVPGSELNWMMDYALGRGTFETYGRYEDALIKVFENSGILIDNLIIGFDDSETANLYKVVTDELSLDLGYDLVFVTFTIKGLQAGDNAAVQISYPFVEYDKDGKTEISVTKRLYREVLFSGRSDSEPVTEIVGLPSGNWAFNGTTWGFNYMELNQDSFSNDSSQNSNEDLFATETNAETGIREGYALIKYKKNDVLTVTLQQNNVTNKVLKYNNKVTNKMIPTVGGTSSKMTPQRN